MATKFDPTQPLPTFDTTSPKVNVDAFLPKFGDASAFTSLPNIRMPDLSFGEQGFFSGFKAFNSFLGGNVYSNKNAGFNLYNPMGSGGFNFGTTGGGWRWPANFKTTPTTTPGSWSGGIGSASGGASILNQYDSAFQKAGAVYGIDPNWLKAVAWMEAGWTGTSGAGAIGLMQIMPNGYPAGEQLYPDWQTNPVSNIMLGAYILDQKRKEQGGDLDRGTMAYLGSGVDPYTGISTDQYLANVRKYYGQLQASGGTVPGGSGTGSASQVISVATSFVGKVPYVWGGIPGKGDTPTGWDCSGFTYWLDQNYGDGTLAMGSHYQYQQMQQQGRMFYNLSQLKPGDLIFFDTGNYSGAGADLNRAGHVAMYIGNGKIVQASNPSDGTNISNLSDYYVNAFIGAAHMSWSG